MLTFLSSILINFLPFSQLSVVMSKEIEVIVEDSIQLDFDEIEVHFSYQPTEEPEKFLEYISKNKIELKKIGEDDAGEHFKVTARQNLKEFVKALWGSELNNYSTQGKSNQSEEAEKRLSEKLIGNAKEQATLIARESGLKITKVLSVEDLPIGGWGVYPPRSAYSTEELPEAFRFEKITLKKKLKIRFKAE